MAKPSTPPTDRHSRSVARTLPGLMLCLALALLAYGLAAIEQVVFGRSWLGAVVLAILLATAIRVVWRPGEMWRAGIELGAGLVLEVAVVLLGASLSVGLVLAIGPLFLLGILAMVALAIPAAYLVARRLELTQRMALLIACGNAICGSSAIAAIAPIIGADNKDVTTAIAFTAVLGIAMVLLIPVAALATGLDDVAAGALAGLTIYAVPQVIAAASPLGSVAVQSATLVKLVRVLMLGPVTIALSLLAPRILATGESSRGHGANGRRDLLTFVPWFVVGFIAMAALRSSGALPPATVALTGEVAGFLTVIAMAALGLGVDPAELAHAGRRALAAVLLSLAVLVALASALVAVAPL